MKNYYFLIIVISLSSCFGKKKNPPVQKEEAISENRIVKPEIQAIIDSAELVGSVLIYDFQKDIYYSNDYEWANKGNLPASTFKITNSIIALENGIVENDSTVFKWDGRKRRFKKWEQDLIFSDAFHFSCVPCYQDIARRLGEKKMNDYLKKLDYGKMEVDSTNIDFFWLEGNSQISQFQQIDFLKRFDQSKLPISVRTEGIMKRMMLIEDSDNYRLSGKTGWSNSNGIDNGWFVGYIELGAMTYFFATNVEPKQQFNMDKFPMIRKEITFKVLRKLDIIK